MWRNLKKFKFQGTGFEREGQRKCLLTGASHKPVISPLDHLNRTQEGLRRPGFALSPDTNPLHDGDLSSLHFVIRVR
ncbi:hypothetical protein MDA_GLEAN10011817 [Myotis davidii]|uniref:Uncharacterized protein n=1 Tax=Myotis davidii TaxID=225400 RepID=L5MJ74_MYODS|nr:hypothetical protein MDA_GLEAN10011817 [Myotis davidii]